MSASISSLISDWSQAALDSSYPGLRLPTCANGTWSHDLPSSCDGCANVGASGLQHKVWEKIKLLPQDEQKAWTGDLVTINNATCERLRILQGIICALHRVSKGVLWSTADYLINGLTSPSSKYGPYEVVSVSGSRYTLRYDEGVSPHPAALTYTVSEYNPDYGIDPEAPEIDNTNYAHAMPNLGIITVGAPSAAQYRGGKIVVGIDPTAKDVTDGNTFWVDVLGTIPTCTMDKWPSTASEDIAAEITIYDAAVEPWEEVRDCHPFYGEEATYQETSPTAQKYTIDASHKLCVSYPFRPTFEKQVGGEWESVEWLSLFAVEPDGATGHKSTLDLSGEDLTGVTAFRVTGWKESTAAAARYCGQDRCRYARVDYSSSWGIEKSGETGRHYCALKTLADGADDFRADCYQYGTCSQFEADTWYNPFNSNLFKQLIHGIPFKYHQVYADAPTGTLYRTGVPSLTALAGESFLLNYYSTEQRYDYMTHIGAWLYHTTYGDADLTLGIMGLGLRNYTDADHLDDETWPEYGPGGNNISGRLPDYGSSALDDDDDPHMLERAQVITDQPTLELFDPTTPAGTYGGENYGMSQRCGSTDYYLYFPQIGSGALQYFNDGIVEVSTPAGWVIGGTTYQTKITCYPGLRLDRTRTRDHGQSLFETEIVSAQTLPSGQIRLDLAHQSFSLKTNTTTTYFKQGGGNVGPPPWCVIRNQNAGMGIGPYRSLAHVGCVVRIKKGDLIDYTFWVTRAEAYGSSNTGSWVDTARYPAFHGSESEYYDDYVAIHSGLPTNHQSWANKYDTIDIEPNSWLTSFISTEGVSYLDGATVEILKTGVMAETGITVYETGPEAVSDTAIGTALTFGASGEIYLPDTYTGSCIKVACKIADRETLPTAAEMNSLITTIERIIGE